MYRSQIVRKPVMMQVRHPALCAGYMEGEAAQVVMPESGVLGALRRLLHRDNAFSGLESEVAVLRHIKDLARLPVYLRTHMQHNYKELVLTTFDMKHFHKIRPGSMAQR